MTNDKAEELFCKTCNRNLPCSSFSKSPNTRSGFDSSCKACRIARRKELMNARRAAATGLKECSNCGISKELSEFRLGYGTDGYSLTCKKCDADSYVPLTKRSQREEQKRLRTEKMCIDCNEVRPLDEYNRRSLSTDGRESRCKDCYRARRREYAKRTQPHKRHPDRNRAMWHNYNAKKLAAEGEITANVIQALFTYFGEKCLACGTESNISIDHVVPLSKGGTNLIDNLQPLCRSCNSIKGNRDCSDYRPFILTESEPGMFTILSYNKGGAILPVWRSQRVIGA